MRQCGFCIETPWIVRLCELCGTSDGFRGDDGEARGRCCAARDRCGDVACAGCWIAWVVVSAVGR